MQFSEKRAYAAKKSSMRYISALILETLNFMLKRTEILKYKFMLYKSLIFPFHLKMWVKTGPLSKNNF